MASTSPRRQPRSGRSMAAITRRPMTAKMMISMVWASGTVAPNSWQGRKDRSMVTADRKPGGEHEAGDTVDEAGDEAAGVGGQGQEEAGMPMVSESMAVRCRGRMG